MITLSWFAVFGIFLCGLALGWTIAKARGGSLSVQLSGSALPEAGAPKQVTLVQQTTIRTLALKCKCGEVWKFTEGNGPHPPGTSPMPTGNSFVCPKCGNSFDMKLERQLEAEALKNLKLPHNI